MKGYYLIVHYFVHCTEILYVCSLLWTVVNRPNMKMMKELNIKSINQSIKVQLKTSAMRKLFTRLSSILVLLFLSIQLAFAVAGGPLLTTTNGLSPADAGTGVSLTPTFTMTFQTNVFPGVGGTFGVYTNAGAALKVVQITGAVTDNANGTVTFSGKTVTVAFKNVTFTEKASYYVKIEGLAIKDADGDAFNVAALAATLPAPAVATTNVWDFQTGDFTDPVIDVAVADSKLDLTPRDNAIGVSTATVTSTVVFKEDVQWAATHAAGTFTYPANLKLEDIALYKDTGLGEEGGDLVSLNGPVSAVIAGKTLTINWAAGSLDPSTNYYIRIKGGIIEDTAKRPFAGINNNTYWSFSTASADKITPVITAGPILATVHASGALWTDDNFFIDFADVLYWSKGNAVANGTVTNPGGITLIDQGGNAIPFTLTYSTADRAFMLNPYGTTANAYLTGTSFTVTIAEGTVRTIDNKVNEAKTVTFNRGDWTAPTFTMQTTNHSGTTFDILIENASEKLKVSYIVVAKDQANFVAPGLEQILGYDKTGVTSINGTGATDGRVYRTSLPWALAGTTLDGYTPLVGTNPIYAYEYAANKFRGVEIFAQGVINVDNPALLVDALKRVTDLPATNGKDDYVVYAVAYDNSDQGVFNPDFTGQTLFTAGPSAYNGNGNIGAVVNTPAHTIDIVMPELWADADSAGYNGKVINKNKVNGATLLNTGAQGYMARKGQIRLNFNEPVRMANGTSITDANIASFVTVTDGGIAVGFSANITADRKQIVIVADSAFKSASNVVVTVGATKIEDLAGNEFQPANAALRSQSFIVETYQPVLALFNPKDAQTGFDGNCINVSFNRILYVPRDDEPSQGNMKLLDNVTTSNYWVGKYFEIREGDKTAATNADAPVKNEFGFEVTYTTTETNVKICRTSGNWESETWYWVQAEDELLDENRYSLGQGNGIAHPAAPDKYNPITTAANDNQTITFQYEDIRPPVVTFYQAAVELGLGQPAEPTPVVTSINGLTNVATTETIGVLIDEWVQLGFADHVDFTNPGALTVDANAMRRYFRIIQGTDTLKFDVRNVHVVAPAATHDHMWLELDPYYIAADGTITDNPNFGAGKTYTVQYISTDKEGVADGAYEDDNKNWAVRAQATFTVAAAAVTPTVAVTYTPSGTAVPASTNQIKLTFSEALHASSIATTPTISFGPDGGPYANLFGTPVAPEYKVVTYNLPALNETQVYRVTATQGSFAIWNGATWPPVSTTNPMAPDSSWTFTTVDGTPPVVYSAVPATPPYALTPLDNAVGVPTTTDLVIRFSENVLPVAGKYLYLWESGVSEILRIAAPSCNHIGGDSIVVPNSWFGHLLKYNTSYHVVVAPGFVTDATGNAFAGIQDITFWNFTTGAQPAVAFSAFSPKDATLDVNQSLKITLNRTATPQVNGQIQIWDLTAGASAYSHTQNSGPVTGLTTTDNKNWTITGFTPIWGHEYTVSISAGYFKASDNSLTPAMNFGASLQATNVATPVWVINFNDVVAPTVKFWPAKLTAGMEEHIPYNAYLYIQFSEPIQLDNGGAIISDPTLIAQNIPAFVQLSRAGNPNVPTLVEFVDLEKTVLRITPLDPAGHNYTGATNATMRPEDTYTLTLHPTNTQNGGTGTISIVDMTTNNTFVGDGVSFMTEDITAPTFTVAPSVNTITSKSVKVSFSISEKSTYYVYVKAGNPGTVDAQTVIANAQTSKTVVAGAVTTDVINLGDTQNEATYTAYVVLVDDEVDVYKNPDPSLWIFTETNDGVDRIRDILPAPNTSVVANTGAFSTCDDDAPYVIAKSPAHLATEVALNAKVYLTFNENITYTGVADGLVKLRKGTNNLQVPATVTVVNGDSIEITPNALLEQEMDYYVEIDRYAVIDATACATNRAAEWVGKTNLFFSTKDLTAPLIDSTNIWAPLTTCVNPDINQFVFYVTEKNALSKNAGTNNGNSIRIYRGINNTGVLLEVIPVADSRVTVGTHSGVKAMMVDVSNFIFLGDDNYYVEVSAGSLKDAAGNLSTSFGWTFSTLDNIPPVANWEIHSLNYRFNNSLPAGTGILSKWYKADSGTAGETASGISSNSMLKIEFSENVQVKTAANTWVDLINYDQTKAATYAGSTTDNALSRAEIFNFLHISGLSYNDDTSKTHMLIKGVTANSILIAFTVDVSQLYVEATLEAGGSIMNPYVGSLAMEAVTYNVTIDKDEVRDIPACSNAPNLMNKSEVVVIETRDDTPPMLDISACGTNACVTATGEIVMTFDKPVVKSSYDILWLLNENLSADNLKLTNDDIAATGQGKYIELFELNSGGADVAAVAIKDINVSSDLKSVRFTPKDALKSNTNYRIVFNKWTVKEYIENDPSGTLFEGDSCVFHVFDYKAPELALAADSLTPADNVVGISTNVKELVLKFNEKVVKGTGIAKIRRENGSIFDEIPASKLEYVGTTKTILKMPLQTQTALEDFTMYYVEMPAGYITDTVACAGYNKFPGFTAQLGSDGEMVSAGWNFSTSDGTPPELLSNIAGELIGLNPVPGDVNVPKNANLVMTFDENIFINGTANAGIVIYYNNGDAPIPGPGQGGDFGNAIEFIPWNSSKITVSGSDIYNGFTSNVVTVNPTTEFNRLGTYYVRVNGDFIDDKVGAGGNLWSASTNTLLDEIKDFEWYFTITNDVAPVLVATTPTYDGVAAPDIMVELPALDIGYVVADLSMTFEDGNGNALDVVKGDAARKVRIYEYVYNPATFSWNDRLWLEMPITDESITVAGNVVTLNDVVLRDGINGDSVYYVTVDPGAILNGFPGSQTFWAGISNGFRWRFQTASDDVFVMGAPDIVSPNVAEHGDDAKDLTIDAAKNLIITFGEGIEALTAPAGKVKVYNADADTLVEAITVTGTMCNGATLTVPTTKLFDETNFYVVLEAGAFGDTSTISTPNPVFGGKDVWAFHTGDNTAPVPTATLPDNADDCVAAAVTLTMTFDNEKNGVAKGDGTITITDGADFTLVLTEADITVDGKVVTAEVAGLPDTTLLTVTVSAGLLLDGDAHSPLPNPVATWSFTTGENTLPTVVSITPALAVTPDTVVTITFSEVVNAATLEGVVKVNGVDVTVTSVDGIVYTGAVTALPSETTVDVVIAEGAFVDVNAGCTANEIAATTLTITVADIVAPTAQYYPSEAGDYKDLELVIVFNEAVAKATGNVVVYDADNDTVVTTIPVAQFASTDNLTYTHTTNDLYYGSFYVLIDAGTFVDATAADIAKEYAGISSETVWPIAIVDTEFDNCVTIISPVDGAQNIALTTELVIEFCTERIVPGSGSKYVTVAKQSDLTQEPAVQTAVDASMISVVGGKYRLTIPVSGLEEKTTYSVIIAPGAVTDEAGNLYEGIIDANAWNFTTVDETAPVVTVVAATVTNVDGTAQLTRDENGPIFLVHSTVPSNLAAITTAIADKKAIAGLVTTANVNVTVSVVGLLPGTYRGVAFDAAGNVGESADVVVVNEVVPVVYPVYTIAQIQGSAAASPYVDDTVTTTGTVTGVDANGFFMQDAKAAWSGIYVYNPELAGIVGLGTGVKVTGKVVEYYDLTEITNVIAYELVARPVAIDGLEMTVNAADVNAEMYESVLVKVNGLKTTDLPDSYGEWLTENNGNVVKIDNQLFAFTPDLGQRYNITGVINYTFSEFKLAPRNSGDIEIVTDIATYGLAIDVYPNPFNDYINIKVSSDVVITKAVITNIAGQLVKEVINPDNSIATSDLRDGVYFISLHTEKGVAKAERIIKR